MCQNMPRVLPAALGLMGRRGSKPFANIPLLCLTPLPSQPFEGGTARKEITLRKASVILAFPSYILTVSFPDLPEG